MSTFICHPPSVFVWKNQVLFADSCYHRVRKILPNGSTVTLAGTGIRGYNGDEQPATMAQLECPRCVFVSERGEVYIAEDYRVRKILTNGMIITIAGTGVRGYNGDGILATAAQIKPRGIFVSADDELFIADYGNHRVRKVLKNGNITTIAGIGIQGYNGDDIQAINAQLYGPQSVFVSNANEVFISDLNNNRIRKIDTLGIITTIAGNGQGGYNGDGISALRSTLNSPTTVMVVNEEIYISDLGNNRIRKVLKNGNITTIAGNGIKGYNGDDILGIDAQLYCPSSVFVSNSNEVFISEYYGNRIRKIDSKGVITTIAGNGKGGDVGDVDYIHSEHGVMGRLVSNNCSEVKILKHERDCLYSSSVIGCLPMIELIAPQFTKNVLNENFISKLDSKEQEVVQQLIDSILYDPEKVIEYDTTEDMLIFLFILNHTYGEFLNLKRNLVTSFVQTLQVNTVLDTLTIIDRYLERSMNVVLSEGGQNFLCKIKEFCFDFITKSLQKPNCALIGDERLNKYSMVIFKAMGMAHLNNLPVIFEKPFQNYGELEQLYNDRKTSDVKIKMKDSLLFCHKSIIQIHV